MIFKKIYILLLAAIVAIGCTGRTEIKENGGNIVLNLKTNSNTVNYTVKSKAISAPEYKLFIYNNKGVEVASYEDCNNLPDIRLAAGDYKFVAVSGEDNAEPAIDAPYFYGESDVTVQAGEKNLVSITAKLANVRVSAKFSEVIKDKTLFSDYSFTIGNAKLTPSAIENGSSIFLSAEAGEFDWTVSVENVQGVKSEISKSQGGVKKCSHYTFSFDVDVNVDENDGDLALDLIVDNTVVELDDNIEINLEQKQAPTLETEGFTSGTPLVIRDIEPREATLLFNFDVYAGTKEIEITHTNADLFADGIPYTMKLSAINAQDKEAANAAGIEWVSPVYEATSPVVSFSKFAQTADLGEYKFYVSLTDKNNQIVEGVLDVAIIPDMEHVPLSAENGAKYAVLYGEWCTIDKPEGLSFQYRTVGATDWTLVDEADLVVTSVENKKYQTRLINLTPETEYEFRTYSPAVQYDDRKVAFTTDAAPEIPNLDFESSYYSGNTWYPNATGGNSFWATGNEGLTGVFVKKPSNTIATSDAVNGGNAVEMTSFNGIPAVGFAAGNIYTGTYKTNMSSPASSAKMGRPYTGRPVGLKGWYKYFPKNIDTNADRAGADAGKPDYCHIYISLEDWGAATTRPANPTVIGYGELRSNKEVDEYTEFEINIVYTSERTPTHVTVAATSSYYGGVFCGGAGSKLFIDDFELLWW